MARSTRPVKSNSMMACTRGGDVAGELDDLVDRAVFPGYRVVRGVQPDRSAVGTDALEFARGDLAAPNCCQNAW